MHYCSVSEQNSWNHARKGTRKACSNVSISHGLGNNVVKLSAINNNMSTTTPTDNSAAHAVERSNERDADQKLVAKVKLGDKAAFDLLVIKYQNKVASVVSRYVSDYHEVADVTQEAFIKAYRAIPNFRGDSAFYTWIYRIAINCAKNYLQARGRRPVAASIEVEDAEAVLGHESLKDNASPEKLLGKDQLESVIKQSIASLPEDLRIALTLREFDNLSYEEIAEIMECPVGTVRSRIFRAREAVETNIKAMRGK